MNGWKRAGGENDVTNRFSYPANSCVSCSFFVHLQTFRGWAAFSTLLQFGMGGESFVNLTLGYNWTWHLFQLASGVWLNICLILGLRLSAIMPARWKPNSSRHSLLNSSRARNETCEDVGLRYSRFHNIRGSYQNNRSLSTQFGYNSRKERMDQSCPGRDPFRLLSSHQLIGC